MREEQRAASLKHWEIFFKYAFISVIKRVKCRKIIRKAQLREISQAIELDLLLTFSCYRSSFILKLYIFHLYHHRHYSRFLFVLALQDFVSLQTWQFPKRAAEASNFHTPFLIVDSLSYGGFQSHSEVETKPQCPSAQRCSK